MKELISKSKICERLFSNEGSYSIESLIAIPAFLIVSVVFCICIRTMFIYEMMDQCFANVAENISHSVIYSQLSHSEGLTENIARITIVDHKLQDEINSVESMWASDVDKNDGFEIIEESFNDSLGVGLYSLNYKIDLLGNKKIVCQHRQRIRSVWQYEYESIFDDNNQENSQEIVYTSTRGRKEGIYHTDANCWGLSRSYKKQGSVLSSNIENLDGYVECKICQQKRLGK